MATKVKTKEAELTYQDLADILGGTFELLQSNGLRVGVKSAAKNDKRPAGLLVYISGLQVGENGKLISIPSDAGKVG